MILTTYRIHGALYFLHSVLCVLLLENTGLVQRAVTVATPNAWTLHPARRHYSQPQRNLRIGYATLAQA